MSHLHLFPLIADGGLRRGAKVHSKRKKKLSKDVIFFRLLFFSPKRQTACKVTRALAVSVNGTTAGSFRQFIRSVFANADAAFCL